MLTAIFQLLVGVVYYTLGNIDPKHRSQLGAIQLLAVATSPIIKKYGIDPILQPFMESEAGACQILSLFGFCLLYSFIRSWILLKCCFLTFKCELFGMK